VERFGKRISELAGGVDPLDDNAAVLNGITKMMPFHADVFCPRMKLIRSIHQFQTASVVFINHRLMHSGVNTRHGAKNV
jgi:hypothetical protein